LNVDKKRSKNRLLYFYSLVALIELITNWKPVQLSLTHEMEREGAKIHDNLIYYSRNTWLPEIGDVRIKYDFAGMSDLANPNYVRNFPVHTQFTLVAGN